jgi:hypothetical protein
VLVDVVPIEERCLAERSQDLFGDRLDQSLGMTVLVEAL